MSVAHCKWTMATCFPHLKLEPIFPGIQSSSCRAESSLNFLLCFDNNRISSPVLFQSSKPNIWRLFYSAPISEGSVLGDEGNGMKPEPEGCLSPGTDLSPQSCRGSGLFYDLSVHISLTKLTQDAGVTETYVISKAGLNCTWHDLL